MEKFFVLAVFLLPVFGAPYDGNAQNGIAAPTPQSCAKKTPFQGTIDLPVEVKKAEPGYSFVTYEIWTCEDDKSNVIGISLRRSWGKSDGSSSPFEDWQWLGVSDMGGVSLLRASDLKVNISNSALSIFWEASFNLNKLSYDDFITMALVWPAWKAKIKIIDSKDWRSAAVCARQEKYGVRRGLWGDHYTAYVCFDQSNDAVGVSVSKNSGPYYWTSAKDLLEQQNMIMTRAGLVFPQLALSNGNLDDSSQKFHFNTFIKATTFRDGGAVLILSDWLEKQASGRLKAAAEKVAAFSPPQF